MMKIRIRRVYEATAGDDFRVFVDRLWPRGIAKDQLTYDMWLKDIAPSPGLRRWFGHDPKKWEEFRRRYCAELEEKADLLAQLQSIAGKRPLTLVYAARDEHHNHALVLKEFLENRPPVSAGAQSGEAGS